MAFDALDTSQNTRKLVPCLKEKGIKAVGRYYTRRRSNPKILTVDEAHALSGAGIQIWPVYQNRHREPADFSAAKGKAEAEDALDYATSVIQQPIGSAIYFSADFDASQATLNNAIRPHFQAIAAAFAAAGNPYRIGVYGSGLVCRSLLDAGIVQLTWLSHSSGFRGTPEFKKSRRWNILQRLGVKNFCNFEDEIDPNEINAANGDFGGFIIGAESQVLLADRIPIEVADGVFADPMALGGPVARNAVFTTIPAYRGTPLKKGELGSDDVRVLQTRLNQLGYGRLVVDGDFGQGTENAVMHFQARNSTPDGRPLVIDGEVGATTWASLFGPGAVFSSEAFDAAAPMRDLVIDIAASQIGVMEEPRGSNRGPEVDVYIRSTGLDPAADSYPWCVCFLYWVFEQAAKVKGFANPLPKTAGVISLWNLGRRTKAKVVRKSDATAATVKPGMIFLLDLGNGKGHAGLVIGKAGDQIITIEGNTNAGGSREGYGVFRRDSRAIRPSVLLGYLDFCDIKSQA